jgi:hypothetical protein
LKSLADYADKPVERISTQDADLAIETAERFIAAIEELIDP